MSTTSDSNDPAFSQMLVICKVIASALVFGVLVFAVIAIVFRLGEPPEPRALVSTIAAVFAAGTVVVRQLVLSVMSGRSVPSQSDVTRSATTSLQLYQTRMIVGLALLEGAAFFNIVAYLVEGHWWPFLVVGALLAWMIAAYPTRTRLQQWIEDREQLKTFGHDQTR